MASYTPAQKLYIACTKSDAHTLDDTVRAIRAHVDAEVARGDRPAITSAYVGVDPGTQGAVAGLDQRGSLLFAVGFRRPAPKQTEGAEEVVYQETNIEHSGSIIYHLCRAFSDVHIEGMVEWQNSRPGEGHKGAFTLGECLGTQRTALSLGCNKIRTVTAQVWQDALGCRSGGDKTLLIRRAQQHWPDLVYSKNGMTSVADALLMALWLQRSKEPFQPQTHEQDLPF